MTITGEMIIGSQLVRGSAGEQRAYNPSTRAEIEPGFGQASGADVASDIHQLIEIANANIAGMRSYINKLRGDATDAKKGVVLVSAIRQQAKKIGEFYGIDIDVHADEIYINDRFSAEVFQIVTEGLSNIKRHTKADKAMIRMSSDGKSLLIEIENNKPDGTPIEEFVPISMTGRAKSLGGRVSVADDAERTTVLIDIPL